LEWVTCWYCGGEGYFDEYDCDPVNVPRRGVELTECEVCGGEGGYLECPNAQNHPTAMTSVFVEKDMLGKDMVCAM